MDALLLLLRWMHIFGAVILAGGSLLFTRFALLPALADTDDTSRDKIQENIRRKMASHGSSSELRSCS